VCSSDLFFFFFFSNDACDDEDLTEKEAASPHMQATRAAHGQRNEQRPCTPAAQLGEEKGAATACSLQRPGTVLRRAQGRAGHQVRARTPPHPTPENDDDDDGAND